MRIPLDRKMGCGLGATGYREDWTEGKLCEVWLLRRLEAKAARGLRGVL